MQNDRFETWFVERGWENRIAEYLTNLDKNDALFLIKKVCSICWTAGAVDFIRQDMSSDE